MLLIRVTLYADDIITPPLRATTAFIRAMQRCRAAIIADDASFL